MKNYILICVFFFFASFNSGLLAQSNKIDIGIVGGPNYCTLVGNDIVKRHFKYAPFYVVGLSVQYNFQHMFSIVSGINYEAKGAGSNIIVTDAVGQKIGTAKYIKSLNYLVMPLLLKATWGKKLKVFVGSGAYAAYLLNSHEKLTSKVVGEFSHSSDTILKKTDAGVVINLGMSIPIKHNLYISLEGRNNIGLMNISTVPLINNQKLNTRSINFLLGVCYQLGQRKA